MNADLAQVFPALALFLVSTALTIACIWAATRLTPWFLGERCSPPTVRSFFLDPHADVLMSRERMAILGLAIALLLAVLLALTCAIRFGGVTLL